MTWLGLLSLSLLSVCLLSDEIQQFLVSGMLCDTLRFTYACTGPERGSACPWRASHTRSCTNDSSSTCAGFNGTAYTGNLCKCALLMVQSKGRTQCVATGSPWSRSRVGALDACSKCIYHPLVFERDNLRRSPISRPDALSYLNQSCSHLLPSSQAPCMADRIRSGTSLAVLCCSLIFLTVALSPQII
jgi:hypothetical protein